MSKQITTTGPMMIHGSWWLMMVHGQWEPVVNHPCYGWNQLVNGRMLLLAGSCFVFGSSPYDCITWCNFFFQISQVMSKNGEIGDSSNFGIGGYPRLLDSHTDVDLICMSRTGMSKACCSDIQPWSSHSVHLGCLHLT